MKKLNTLHKMAIHFIDLVAKTKLSKLVIYTKFFFVLKYCLSQNKKRKKIDKEFQKLLLKLL